MNFKKFMEFYKNVLIKSKHIDEKDFLQMMNTDLKSNFFYITAKDESLTKLMLNFDYLAPMLKQEQADIMIIQPNSIINGPMIKVTYKNIPQTKFKYNRWIIENTELSFLERFKFSSIIPFLFLGNLKTDSLFCQGNIEPTVIKIFAKLLSKSFIFVNVPDIKEAKDNYNFCAENLCVISYNKPEDIPQITQFDRVVCIAPSSNDGSFYDTKEDWSVDKAISNNPIQKEYLRCSLKKLKPTGICVYATFSINPIENEDVVNSVLNEFNDEFRIVDCSQTFSEIKRFQGLTSWSVKEFNSNDSKVDNINFCMRFYSHLIHSDSTFVAVIERASKIDIEIQAQEKPNIENPIFKNVSQDILNNIANEFGFPLNDFFRISFLYSKIFRNTIFYVSTELDKIIKANKSLNICRIGSPSFVFINNDMSTIPIPSYYDLPIGTRIQKKRIINIDYDILKILTESLSISINVLPEQTQHYLKSIKPGGIYINIIPSNILFGAYLDNAVIQLKMSTNKVRKLFNRVKYFTICRPVALGNADFYKLRRNNDLYVDKTDFIRIWWKSSNQVTLITRPRRFGKTLTLRMVRCFFSCQNKNEGEKAFEKTKIWGDEEMMEHQGNYQVIFISFSIAKSNNVKKIIDFIKCKIVDAFLEFKSSLLESNKLDEEQINFIKSINYNIDDNRAATLISNLCSFINNAFNQRVIILLDEYDTPMTSFWTHRNEDDWATLIFFLRAFFDSTFKDNFLFERAIITGITQIFKESIFSGLNNLFVDTITSMKYSNFFGFTSEEVKEILKNSFLSYWEDEVIKWYEGYHFGSSKEMYNPWSITSFVNCLKKPSCFWVNTSDNSLINDLIRNCSNRIHAALIDLLQDKTCQFIYQEYISYNDFYNRIEEAIFNLLVATGYITVIDIDQSNNALSKIPNFEVKKMFIDMIDNWFRPSGKSYTEFINNFLRCNIKSMKKNLDDILKKCISGFDTMESFYHGLVLGMLVNLMDSYQVLSNYYSGKGRPDVLIIPRNNKKNANVYIIEFKSSRKYFNKRKRKLTKKVDKFKGKTPKEILLKLAQDGLNQIDKKEYATILEEEGIKNGFIIKYSISFNNRKCLILLCQNNIVRYIYDTNVEEYVKTEEEKYNDDDDDDGEEDGNEEEEKEDDEEEEDDEEVRSKTKKMMRKTTTTTMMMRKK